MEVKAVNSYAELQEELKKTKKSYLLIYKQGSEQSDCAYNHIKEAAKEIKNINILSANVAVVRDIHPKYDIKTAPTLLEFEGTNFGKSIKGCHDVSYYKAVFENAVFTANMPEGKRMKSVTVYSTPSCPWCNRLKDYLRQRNVPFRDVDVSKDQKAAEELVKRTGQQGVPQTNIDGQFVVGFDKKKIDQLLELA